MKPTARIAALIAQVVTVTGAFGTWLPHTPGLRIAFGALTDPHHHAVPRAGIGVGWIVIAAAAIGMLAALAGSRPLLTLACIVEFALIVDFIVFEAIRRAPGNYNAADIAWGCWFVMVAALAGLLIVGAGTPRRRFGSLSA